MRVLVSPTENRCSSNSNSNSNSNNDTTFTTTSNITLVNCVLEILGKISFDIVIQEFERRKQDNTAAAAAAYVRGDQLISPPPNDIEMVLQLDITDSNFWAPLVHRYNGAVPLLSIRSHSKEGLLEYISQINTVDEVMLNAHYRRMKEFVEQFLRQQHHNDDEDDGGSITNFVNEITNHDPSCWWHYGQMKQNYYKNRPRWNRFWEIFCDEEWEWGEEEEIEKDGGSADQVDTHPLYTAIHLGYQLNSVITDIVKKDPRILETFDHQECLPPFALVTATWSLHKNSYRDDGLINDITNNNNDNENSKNKNNDNDNDKADKNYYHYYLDTTYELLRMNPAVIGTMMTAVE